MSLLNTNKLYSACFRNIPHGWNELRLKYVANAVVEKPKKRNLLAPYVGLEHVGSGIGRLLQFDESFEDSSAILCRKGDVLFGKLRPYLAKCFLAEREFRCSSEFLVLRSSRYNPNYLRYLLLTKEFIELVNASTYGAKMPRASWDFIGNIIVPLPPMNVQEEIANYLDQQTAKLDQLIEKKQRLIDLLQEKRQTLITQAVTKGLDPNVPMKDSGIEWLGKVPAHWDVVKIKHVALMRSGHTPSRQHPEYWEDCNIPWFTLADVWQIRDGRAEYLEETEEKISILGLENSAAELLPAGTVILSRTASVGFSGIMAKPMATSQDFVNWVCGPKIIPEYLLYVFRSMKEEFKRLVMGSTHKTIYMPDAAAFKTPLPPIEEQHQIVRYIRKHKTSIDRLEDLTLQSIQKLQEYRQALITAAVTGQIDVREKLAGSAEPIPAGKE